MLYKMYAALCTVLLSLIITMVLSAPVAQKSLDDLKAALRTQLKDQESALESLASVADKAGSSGVEYSKTKATSYSNINGAENSDTNVEEKVLEPQTQKVISDLKEHLQQKQASPEADPKTTFQASVDVPEEGIHKTFSNDDSKLSGLKSSDMKDTIEFTPQAVAEYLYRTGERQEFLTLLNELVEAGEISSEEAEQYEKAVMDALYALEQANMNMEPLYTQNYGDGPQQMFPVYNPNQVEGNPEDVYPLYNYGQAQTKPSPDTNMDSYINYLLNKPVSLDEMINTLLDEWLTRAIVTGDPEAEEILTNIVDYVSRDNDPNDEAQVKAILGDIFATALLEDLTPRIQPQPMADTELYREVPAADNTPVESVESTETDAAAVSQEVPQDGTQGETSEQTSESVDTPQEQAQDQPQEQAQEQTDNTKASEKTETKEEQKA